MPPVTKPRQGTESNPLRSRLPPIVLIALLAWEALRESGPLTIGDVFWHLRTGDLVLADGPPRTDMFSWTAGGDAWKPNAWAGDALWAMVRAVAGHTGVSLLSGIAVLGVALLLYRAGRQRGAGPWASVAASSLTVVFLAPFIAPRPLLLGFALLPLALALATRYRKGSRSALIQLIFLVALWSNLHGGFVMGVGIIGLMAIGWAIDKRTLANPAALAAGVFAAGLFNPYGLSSYVQAIVNRRESVTIEEWQPLALDDGRGISLAVFMVLTALAFWLTRATRPAARRGADRFGHWETALPLLGLAAMTLNSIRIGSFLLIVAAPLLARGLSEISAPGVRAWAATRVVPLTTGLVLAGVILAVQQAPEVAKAGDPAPLFSESVVAAIPADCRLLNEYDLGGFIIDRRWPDVLVSQDGRADLYGLDELRRQERLFNANTPAMLETDGIGCVIANVERPLTAALRESPDWTITAESAQLVLLVKN